MRSHAKASTAGSTQRQAKGLGRFFRGADVRRGAPLEAKGRSAHTLPFALLGLLLSLAVGVGSASAAAPTIPSTSTSTVTTTTAVLNAEVNPEGEAATYHFEYGPADCASNPCTSIPTPDGNVGAGSSVVKITKEAKGLQPGTTYHFRVVATNGSGPTASSDRTFVTYATPSESTDCPNQAFRVGFSAGLPDCRAYEMVSPVKKGGASIVTLCQINCWRTALVQASLNGEKITFSSYKAFGDALGGHYTNQYIATRGADGWSSHGISPSQSTSVFDPGFNSAWDLDLQFRAFTPDLSSAWLTDDNTVPLTPDGIPGHINLYRRDDSDDSYHALTINAPIASFGTVFNLEFQGTSADGSHALFYSTEPLTLDAAMNGSRQLYDFSAGQLHFVGILPDGTASSTGSGAGASPNLVGGVSHGASTLDHAISDDGSRIFWSSNPKSVGKIYVRIDGTTTHPISTGIAQFWAASGDGSTAVFGEGEDLFKFDVNTETPTLIAHEVKGVAGTSDDASYVYFASTESLAAGATAGERNLYLDHDGTISFIATLSAEDLAEGTAAGSFTPSIVSPNPSLRDTRVTPDGHVIAFMSTRSLTGYDNTDVLNGEADSEVYAYDASTQHLVCASCNPSGAPPIGRHLHKPYKVITSETTELWAAAWIPTWENSFYASRSLSEDGSRLVFNSFDALAPQDTNGKQDVYEWEAQGRGTCQRAGGCVSLMSSGESPQDSEFVDASPGGNDVFIGTESSLIPQDPGLADIYDARTDGGFPLPPLSPAPCFGDACQSIPAAPNDATPASANFRGAGDPVQRPRRDCRARHRHSKIERHAERKRVQRCKRTERRAGR